MLRRWSCQLLHLENMLGMELVDVPGINNNCLLHAVLSQVRGVGKAWLGLVACLLIVQACRHDYRHQASCMPQSQSC